MNLSKSRDFFDPNKVKGVCHIIGCGSIGSNVAELLTRYGVNDFVFWDFDEVESHNLANQIFYDGQVGLKKTSALLDICLNINADITVETIDEGWQGEKLEDYVFLCVDNIDIRREIVEANINNKNIIAMFDFRTSLEEGQCYFADWSDPAQRTNFLNTMMFSHEEAQAENPVSACGFELSVSPVVKSTAIYGICNFTNFINGKETPPVIITKPYDFNLLSL